MDKEVEMYFPDGSLYFSHIDTMEVNACHVLRTVGVSLSDGRCVYIVPAEYSKCQISGSYGESSELISHHLKTSTFKNDFERYEKIINDLKTEIAHLRFKSDEFNKARIERLVKVLNKSEAEQLNLFVRCTEKKPMIELVPISAAGYSGHDHLSEG